MPAGSGVAPGRLEDPVALVKSRADILEVIGAQVVLKKRGRNHIGLCPFHGEKTPSFNVNAEKQIFKCFGCGKGGDLFSFVMEADGVEFGEALSRLAERYGVVLPERAARDRQQGADERKAIKEANELALVFYREVLASEAGAEARKYLDGRGVPGEMAERFALGFAPARGDALHRHLSTRGVPVAAQLAAGLVRERPSGGYYDYFRGRLLFPIQGELGQVLGFGGRSLGNDEPKYLNTAETPLYHKGEILYGLHLAKEGIKAKDRTILMEGYMDVLTAHQHGFTEAVGVLGTALTPQQAKSLLRYTPSKRVIVSYDADRAGRTATARGVQVLEEVAGPLELAVSIIAVPSGKDPDAFLRAAGPGAFEYLIAGAQPLFEFQLEEAIRASGADLTRPEGKGRAIAACLPLLARLSSLVTRDAHIRQLARRLSVREESIRLELRRSQKAGRSGGPTVIRPRMPGPAADPTREAELGLLYLLIEHPALREEALGRLMGIPFQHPTREEVRQRIAEWPAGERLTFDLLLASLAGTPAAAALSDLMFEAQPEKWKDSARVADDFIRTLEKHDKQQELRELERLRLEGHLRDEEMEPILRRVLDLQAEIQALHAQNYLGISQGNDTVSG